MSSTSAREEVIWPGVRARWFETEHESTVDANVQPMLQITARLQGLGGALVSLPLAAMCLYSVSQHSQAGEQRWWVSAYKLFGVWLWAFLGYACVVVAVNSIMITVNRTSLVVKHSPLPWRPTRTIPIGLVDLVYPRTV